LTEPTAGVQPARRELAFMPFAVIYRRRSDTLDSGKPPFGTPGSGRHPGETPALRPALALSNKPSIAVLPFQNMSGDPEQEDFADGMVEEMITVLKNTKSIGCKAVF